MSDKFPEVNVEIVLTQAPSPAPTIQLYPPTRGPTPQPVAASNERQAVVSVALEGVPELLDPSSNLLVESAVTELLSEQVTEIEGVSIFFLKTQVLSQKPFPSRGGTTGEIVLVELRVHAVAVGGRVDDRILEESIKQSLDKNKDELVEQLKSGLESLSFQGNSLADELDTGASGGNSSTNMVILVAVIASVMIGLLVFSIACIAVQRKQRNDIKDLRTRSSISGLSTQSHREIVTNNSSRRIWTRHAATTIEKSFQNVVQ